MADVGAGGSGKRVGVGVGAGGSGEGVWVGVGARGSGEVVWLNVSVAIESEETVSVAGDSESEHPVTLKMATSKNANHFQQFWAFCLTLFSSYLVSRTAEASKRNETFTGRCCWLAVSHVP